MRYVVIPHDAVIVLKAWGDRGSWIYSGIWQHDRCKPCDANANPFVTIFFNFLEFIRHKHVKTCGDFAICERKFMGDFLKLIYQGEQKKFGSSKDEQCIAYKKSRAYARSLSRRAHSPAKLRRAKPKPFSLKFKNRRLHRSNLQNHRLHCPNRRVLHPDF